MSTPKRWRLVPPVWMIFALALQWALNRWLPLYRFDVPWLGGAGVLLMIAALLLWGASAWQFSRHKTTIEPSKIPSALIARGPYRLSRNPLYLAMAMVVLAYALRLQSASTFLPIVGFAWVISALFVAHEERLLHELFGKDYADYQRSVRRWL